MRKLSLYLLALLWIGFGPDLKAQRGYEEQIRKDGVLISTKWGNAKDEDGNRRRALLLKVENTGREAINYSFKVNFFYEGILRETGVVGPTCLEGLKSRVGLLNGMYLITNEITDEQLQAPDFGFEMDEVEIVKIAECDP